MSVTAWGSLVPSETRETLSELYTDPDADFPTRYLWDLRETTIDWSSDAVKELVDWVEANRPPGEGRTAIVVAHDVQFGLARMFGTLAANVPVEQRVFRDLEAATVWLTG